MYIEDIDSEKYPVVFMSYAREDFDKVILVYEALQEANCYPWIDQRDILGGQDWEKVLRKAISNSHFFVPCFSRKAISKIGVFQRELKLSFKHSDLFPSGYIYCIPLLLEPLESNELPEQFQGKQWINVFKESGIKMILQSIEEGSKQRDKKWTIPKIIPTVGFTHPNQIIPAKFLTELVKTQAVNISLRRIVQKYVPLDLFEDPSSRMEMVQDWRNAEVDLVIEILDGNINFAHNISEQSYSMVENLWIDEVKQAKAKRLLDQLSRKLPEDSQACYFQVCEVYRQSLKGGDIKESPAYFKNARAYLERRYLVSVENFGIDSTNDGIKHLIIKKAERICQVTGGVSNHMECWHHAKMYVEMFYQNIVAAIVNQSMDATLAVLTAFEYSKRPEHRFKIINCFEAALAIYFLQPNLIKDIWSQNPDSFRGLSI